MSEPLLPSRFDVEPALAGVIGWSELGVPLHVHYVGRAAAPLRVLMLAGQHGDEGRARAAVGQFLEAGPASKKLESMSLAVLPNLNPDGTLVKSRANANELDLNRDHLLLDSAETQALHRFVRVWRPHLVIDVHTYPSRRRYLLAHNLTHCHDVFLDVPTNPAAACVGATEILHALLTRLNRRGYLADRYVRPTNSGRVRHSTADVLDVRNSLAIRYGIPTLLVEGRQPLRSDGAAERTRLKAALIAALEIALQCAEEYQQALRALPAVPEAGAGIAIRCRYTRGDSPCRIPLRDTRSGVIRTTEMPGAFCPNLKVTKRAILPRAYAVPQSHQALLEVLRRHELSNYCAHPCTVETVESYRVRCSEDADRPLRRRLIDRIREQRTLAGYVLFPVTPESGRALSIYLEPESKYGLHRFPVMDLTLRPGRVYPVLTTHNDEGRPILGTGP